MSSVFATWALVTCGVDGAGVPASGRPCSAVVTQIQE